jgi:hypothetical protein
MLTSIDPLAMENTPGILSLNGMSHKNEFLLSAWWYYLPVSASFRRSAMQETRNALFLPVVPPLELSVRNSKNWLRNYGELLFSVNYADLEGSQWLP